MLIRTIFVLFPLLALCSCSSGNSSPLAVSRYFPNPERLQKMPDTFPFQAFWHDEDKVRFLKKQYHKIFFRPVSTIIAEERINASTDSDEQKKERVEELKEVARYMEERFKQDIREAESPALPLEIVEELPSDGFVVELSLTEVQPTSATVNVLGTIAGMVAPIGNVIRLAGKGYVSMEGVARDGATMIPIALWKDRRRDKEAPLTTKNYQSFANIRSTIDYWAEQFANLAVRAPRSPAEQPVRFIAQE